jgi:hypothetical protein
MKLIREAADSEPSLVAGFQQSASPAYFGMIGYSDEYARVTQADGFGVPIA